jgi:hypothetical protein
MRHCNKETCRRLCMYCILQWAGLPLEHGLWEWTRLERLLPLIGLHI